MGWSFQQKPPMGWPLDYDSGLVPDAGFWLFNEGSGGQVFDLSGNDRHGTLDATNPPVWKSGKFGSALDINVSAIQPIALSSTISLTKGTIAGWIYWSGSITKMFIGDNTTDSYIFYLNTFWRLKTSGGSVIEFSDALPSAGWHHVVFTCDGTNFYLYVNSFPDSGNPKAGVGFNVNTIGNSYDSNSYTWDGDIDNVMIWKRFLTASEIALLYREPFCMFKDPAEMILSATAGQVAVGMAGAMTTNTGSWGW